MSVPKNVFIDTSIFDQQNHNFESAAFGPFIAAIADKHFKLLLPDPVTREVRRHIAERADAVVSAVGEGWRKAPFLAKMKDWPKPGFALSWEVRNRGMEHWKEFLKHFDVQELGLETASLRQVMQWYDTQQSPFGPKKKKEFPDALAFSSLLAFAKKERATIAVISADPDFVAACARFSEVLCFQSLPAFTQALIASDHRVDAVLKILGEDTDMLWEAVKDEFSSLYFYHGHDHDARVENVDVDDVNFVELYVVGLGEKECAVAFSASVPYSVFVDYEERDSAIVDSSEDIFHKHHRYRGVVTECAEVSGTAKIRMSEDWSAFQEITHFEFNESEVEIGEIPPEETYYG